MGENPDLSLFPDEYSFNDTLTGDMPEEDIKRYLLTSAIEYRDCREPEVEYGILRELVHRFPTWSYEAWMMLSDCAKLLKKDEEAKAAATNGERVRQAVRRGKA